MAEAELETAILIYSYKKLMDPLRIKNPNLRNTGICNTVSWIFHLTIRIIFLMVSF